MVRSKNKGVRHHYTDEQLAEFAKTTTQQRLEWLGALHSFLSKTLTPEKIETMRKFRNDEL